MARDTSKALHDTGLGSILRGPRLSHAVFSQFLPYTLPTPQPKQAPGAQNAKAVLIRHWGMPLAFPQDNPAPPPTCPTPYPSSFGTGYQGGGQSSRLSLGKLQLVFFTLVESNRTSLSLHILNSLGATVQ